MAFWDTFKKRGLPEPDEAAERKGTEMKHTHPMLTNANEIETALTGADGSFA